MTFPAFGTISRAKDRKDAAWGFWEERKPAFPTEEHHVLDGGKLQKLAVPKAGTRPTGRVHRRRVLLQLS